MNVGFIASCPGAFLASDSRIHSAAAPTPGPSQATSTHRGQMVVTRHRREHPT